MILARPRTSPPRSGSRSTPPGATDPAASLKRGETAQPWSLCRRPWTLMYFTAHGRALPCCIAPFSMRGYDAFTLGDATQQTLREIWNGERYQDFRAALLSDAPPAACAGCGLRWSLYARRRAAAVVAAVIPCLNEQDAIAGVIAAIPARASTEVIVVDSGSTDGTVERAAAAGAGVVIETTPRLRARLPGGRPRPRADCEILVFLDGDGSDCPE